MTEFIGTDIIGPASAITDFTTPGLVDGGDLYIAAGVNVVSTTGRGVFSQSIDAYSFAIAGNIISDVHGIYLRRTDATSVMDFNVSVLDTGSIYSATDRAIEIFNDGGAAAVTGTIAITNAGSIGAQTVSAIFVGAATRVQINNSGHIWSNSNTDFFSNAIIIIGSDDVRITNTGLIETTALETSSISSLIDDVAAISISSPGTFAGSLATYVNSGTITGGSHSFFAGMETIRLTNLGTMNGIIQTEAGTGGSVLLRNSGDIIGDVRMGDNTFDASVDRIVNSGTIDGNVLMRAGDDTMLNSGIITGDVDLGSGADRYVGPGGGVVIGTVLGGSGNDTLNGGDGDDEFYGGFDNDRLRGNLGNDSLVGEDGDDTLLGGGGDDSLEGGGNDDILDGGAGEDVLFGGDNNDILKGQDGDDKLDGGSGDDTLRGQDGDDNLTGGLGRDVMFGGAGADLFIFNSLADSGISAARDVIIDFEQGFDRVNLQDVSASVLDFLGSGAFTATGTAELRITESASGTSIVHIDEDGNGTTDMQIAIVGVIGLMETDFIL